MMSIRLFYVVWERQTVLSHKFQQHSGNVLKIIERLWKGVTHGVTTVYQGTDSEEPSLLKRLHFDRDDELLHVLHV